ncbi:MAG TPA: TolC family protein, partial [bacterium]|nr:TolC family protein [bacterium]
MEKIFYGFILAIWGLANGAGAQTLTLEQAIRTVWENAPQIRAQKSLAGIYSDDTWRRWFPEEPTLSWEDDYSDTFYTWGISLTYPFPFKSLVLSQLDSAMAEQQRWEFTAQKYDLAVSITQAYMNGATAQAMIEFQKQNVQDLETIAEAIRLQYIHGQSNQINKISAELQLTAAQRDLKTAEDQLDTAVELYARLMGIPPSQVTGFDLPDDLPSSIVKELGNKTSAQLRDKANEDVGEANRATGFWSQFPDPTFSLSKDYYLQPALNDSPTGN